MTNSGARLRILQQVEDGGITAAEAEQLLRDLSDSPSAPPPSPPPEPELDHEAPPEVRKWRQFWLTPFFLAVTTVVIGGWLTAVGLRPGASFFWLLCGMVPFWGGVLLMALAFATRKSRWVHVRVKTGQDEWPRNIAISLPIPLRLTAWALRTFGHHVPQLDGTGLDEVLLALDESDVLDKPLYIEVDEGNGEQVQVYFG